MRAGPVSLRKRLSLVAAASVAVAVLIAVVVCYMVVRSQLLGQGRAQLSLAPAAFSITFTRWNSF